MQATEFNMEGKSKQHVRDELSIQFADAVGRYQQEHHDLMHALYDNAISIEDFEERSRRLKGAIDVLKQMRVELKRQRDLL